MKCSPLCELCAIASLVRFLNMVCFSFKSLREVMTDCMDSCGSFHPPPPQKKTNIRVWFFISPSWRLNWRCRGCVDRKEQKSTPKARISWRKMTLLAHFSSASDLAFAFKVLKQSGTGISERPLSLAWVRAVYGIFQWWPSSCWWEVDHCLKASSS